MCREWKLEGRLIGLTGAALISTWCRSIRSWCLVAVDGPAVCRATNERENTKRPLGLAESGRSCQTFYTVGAINVAH